MKKQFIIYYLLFIILTCSFLTGCAGLRARIYAVTIRAENNLSSVLAGGTLILRASGRNIEWSVSSTPDGRGAVAGGTSISQTGILAVSANENLLSVYVTARSLQDDLFDTKQIRIVTVSAVTVSPANQTVSAGRTSQFRASVSGSNNPDQAVRWTVSAAAFGTGGVTPGTSISSSGLLRVAPNESLSTLYIIASSIVDPSKSGNVFVTVVIPVITAVTVTPANQTMSAGRTLQFRSSVTGTYDPDTTVRWTVSSNPAGTGAVTPGTRISSSGMLTVAANETLTVLYIIATSVYDPSKSGSVVVNILVPAVTQVIVLPSGVSIMAGNSYQFRANVTGINNPNTSVRWAVSSNAAGTGAVTPGTFIDSNGRLTVAANETARNLFVFATSVFDSTKSGSVAIAVTPAPTPPPITPTIPPVTPTPAPPTVTGVNISPSSVSTQTNRTVQYSAVVTGTNNPAASVTWRVGSNPNGSGQVAPRTTVSSSGLLTIAPNEWNPTLYIIATSTADTSKSGIAVVSVTNANQNQRPNQGN